MNPRVGRVPALGRVISSGIRRTIGIDLVLAVRLVVVLAMTAVQTGVYLGTNTNTLTKFCERHLGTHADNLPNDLVADSQWVGYLTPISTNGVHVTSAHAATFNLDIDIVITKRTRLPRTFLKFEPIFSARRLESPNVFGVGHEEWR